MKLKYYMRGLGIGIVVTALLLSVLQDKNTKTWSDEEVRARAKELGMIESTVLSQLSQQEKSSEMLTEQSSGTVEENSGEKQENSAPAKQPEEEKPVDKTESEKNKTEENKTEENKTEENKTEESRTEENKTEENKTEESIEQTKTDKPDESESQVGTDEEEQLVTIVIVRGESSESVSRSLEEAGLVEDAKEFDKYLCANGYDKKISVGTYKILTGTTEKEIANIISKGR